MDRRDLEGLTRDELLALARSAGVDGAEWLSREELVVALGRGSGLGRLGLFDRARALLDKARELGRTLTGTPPISPTSSAASDSGGTPDDGDDHDAPPDEPGAPRFETLTMAEVYAAQGLADDARRIASALLARDPDHPGARALLDRLAEQALPADAGDEPPAAYGQDIACLHLVRPDVLYAWWEVTPDGRGRAQGLLGAPGQLTLRLSTATANGAHLRDTPIDDQPVGDLFLRDVMTDARHRVAVGLLGPEGRFAPIAHSQPLWTPRVEPCPDTRIEWMEVPLAAGGRTVSPPQPTRRAEADLREQGRAHRRASGGA